MVDVQRVVHGRGALALARHRSRHSADNAVKHDEDRELHHHRQAAARRAHSVLAIESHHLGLLLLSDLPLLFGGHPRCLLVPGAHLQQLRLEQLHLHHRPRALPGQREDSDHRHKREENDRQCVVVCDAEESGKYPAEYLREGPNDRAHALLTWLGRDRTLGHRAGGNEGCGGKLARCRASPRTR